jgi:hypothetical protein
LDNDLSGTEYTLTGIDLDPVAFELRKTRTRDLDVAVGGDITSVNCPWNLSTLCSPASFWSMCSERMSP